ncbi:GntR family transcriptional regulator [Modestobacter sp. NPDC049651]|uniref:GntR family transcriptional regulator n=1 Tax=unclassified Modestobacter TaxID=2643866 RepID=UPI0033C94773
MTDSSAPQGTPLSGARGRETAEERLRDEIARGDLVPGQRLVEADLAERYGVTRNGARLALDALAAEGLVERIPNRGARVRTVSTAEAVAIMECRLVLDGLVARKAATAVTDADAGRLAAHADRLAEALAAGELVRYSQLIQELHALLRETARQPVAAALVERLQAQIVRHQFRLSLRPGRPQRSLVELQRVVAAVCAGDADAAEAAARAHMAAVIAALEATPEAVPGA